MSYDGVYTPYCPGTSRQVSLTVLADASATVAAVEFTRWDSKRQEHDTVRTTGSSKRAPGDKPDEEVGELLAVADALEKLAGKLRRRATGRSRHLDSIARHRAGIRDRKQAGALGEANRAAKQKITSLFALAPVVLGIEFDILAPVPAHPSARDQAGDVLDAAKASQCYAADTCVLDPRCPFSGPHIRDAPDEELVVAGSRDSEELIAQAMAGNAVEVEYNGDGTVTDVTPDRIAFVNYMSGRKLTMTVSARGLVRVYSDSGTQVRAFLA